MAKERNNSEVFAGAATVSTTPADVAARQRNEFDDLLEVPVEAVPLPSGGKIYGPDTGLHLVETVDIKSMTAKEEDILTSQAYAKKGTMLTQLIRSCLTNKQINPADLVVGDRYAILLAIRITGYGASYTDQVECGECSFAAQQTFDMTQFPIKRLKVDPVRPGENLFEFTLPKSGHTVLFRLMTGRDEEDMHTTDLRLKKAGIQSDANVTSTLTRTIVSVKGVTDPAKISRYVREAMPAADSSALRKYMSEIQPGMEFEQQLTCPSCGHQEVVQMPLGLGFLWPNSQRQN